MAWLNDHPPARSQYRHPRRETVSGVIAVHTAENAPDVVAFDGGAEAVANFIRNRDTPGSYHRLADSDSIIKLVELGDEAFHDATGTNRHSIGISAATRADVWPLTPLGWRAGVIRNMAKAAVEAAAYVKTKTGIIIPAKRITAAAARDHRPGFVPHADLDPERRTDPGKAFPWSDFLDLYARLNPDITAPAPKPKPNHQELPTMTLVFVSGGIGYRMVTPWGIKKLTDAEGYELDVKSDAIAAVRMSATLWSKLTKGQTAT